MILKASDQTRALIALTNLADEHPHLPAPEMHVHGHISLSAMVTVEVVLHGDEDGFEAWRQALGIDPGDVQQRQLSLGGRVSSAHTIRLGVAIVLTVHHRQEAPPARVLAAVA
ncbi:hypothetical protein OG229_02780 [Streptomyces platensis]|uniref:hypothetical protein n=1 Tax=Streptomyces platensis TaxID=58346 RepID=UPI002E13A59E|nr:hypothetical protein OG229_02780 [Streptomyces platensis]